VHESEWGEGQRETEREILAESSLSLEPDMGLSVTTLRPQAKPKPRVRCPTD